MWDDYKETEFFRQNGAKEHVNSETMKVHATSEQV